LQELLLALGRRFLLLLSIPRTFLLVLILTIVLVLILILCCPTITLYDDKREKRNCQSITDKMALIPLC
jgi:hypothetical protein